MEEHYYTKNPESRIKEIDFNYKIKDVSLNFTSVSGVFSFKDKIDKATELLIKNFTPSGEILLDLGCGYGAIGLFLKALFPEQCVYMSDINIRAVEYSLLNSKKNNLKIKAMQSNLFSEINDLLFDDIVTNPPIAAGKDLNISLINDSYDFLKDNGALWLVAYHNKGGSTYKSIMEKRFGNVKDIVKSGGIRVYKSVK